MKQLIAVLCGVVVACGCLAGPPRINPAPLPADTNNLIPPGSFPTGFFGQAYSVFSVVGIEGQNPPKNPVRAVVSVYNAQNNLVRRVVSNPVGQFYCYLPAGNYTLLASYLGHPLPPRSLGQYVPPPPESGLRCQPTNIVVSVNKLTPVEVEFGGGGI
jgi:hypothetical protein